MRLPMASSSVATTRRVLLAAAAGLINLSPTAKPAFAAYTVVASGNVAQKRSRLTEVEKLFKEKPDDPYVFGEKAQLEADIKALKRNSEYASSLSRDLAGGKVSFLQSIRVGVPDMDEAVRFWTRGCGALILSTKRDGSGANVTRIGFGAQSLRVEDGAKFALELVEAKGEGVGVVSTDTSALQYIQLSIPVFRLSQVMANGGDIESAYGWTQLTAPGGLPLRVHIDEQRRDPFEFVGLRVSDMAAAIAHYEGLGMKKVSETDARRKFELGGSFGVRQQTGDAFEPDREPGTVQMTFGDPTLTTGLLLLPPKKRGAKLSLGKVVPCELSVIGKSPTTTDTAVSPDGLKSVYVDADAFETAVAAA